jgi:hypothetical protein
MYFIPFYATQIISPFLNSRISANLDKVDGLLATTGEILIKGNFSLLQNLFSFNTLSIIYFYHLESPTKAAHQTPVVQIVQEKPVLVSPVAATDKPVVTSPIIKLAPETPKPVLHQLNVQTLRTQTSNGQTTSFLVKDNNITSIEVLPLNSSTRVEKNVSSKPTTSLHKLSENTIVPEIVTTLTSTSTVSSSVISNISGASIMTPSNVHNSYISTLHLQPPRINHGDKKHIFIAPKPGKH